MRALVLVLVMVFTQSIAATLLHERLQDSRCPAFLNSRHASDSQLKIRDWLRRRFRKYFNNPLDTIVVGKNVSSTATQARKRTATAQDILWLISVSEPLTEETVDIYDWQVMALPHKKELLPGKLIPMLAADHLEWDEKTQTVSVGEFLVLIQWDVRDFHADPKVLKPLATLALQQMGAGNKNQLLGIMSQRGDRGALYLMLDTKAGVDERLDLTAEYLRIIQDEIAALSIM